MNPKLQAGVEILLEKEAAVNRGDGILANAILRNADKFGLVKAAAQGMECKNKQYGKGEVKLDDDPTKGKKAKPTGKTVNNSAGKNITTEASGMPDLTKSATDRRGALRDVLLAKSR